MRKKRVVRQMKSGSILNKIYDDFKANQKNREKKELKQRYLDEFDADWKNRRNVAFEILQHAKKTSN